MLVAGSLAACASERPGDERPAGAGVTPAESVAAPATDSTPAPGDTVRHAERVVARAEGECRREMLDTAAVPCVTVEIRYPELDAPVRTVADSLAAMVWLWAFSSVDEDTTAAPSAEAAADGFVAGYREAVAASGDRVQLWELERAVTVACNTPRVVGLRIREYVYTGGAHPNTWSHLASFDARTGRRLDLAALFVTDSLPAVTRLGERAFRRERGIPAGQPLDSAGFHGFDDGRFVLPDNVLACDDAVTFHFNAYDVAPYVMGHTEFSVPTAELRPHLRATAPVGR